MTSDLSYVSDGNDDVYTGSVEWEVPMFSNGGLKQNELRVLDTRDGVKLYGTVLEPVRACTTIQLVLSSHTSEGLHHNTASSGGFAL